MNYIRFCLTAALLILLISCGQNKSRRSDTQFSFPYQSYLDSMRLDESFPTIGNDGKGFAAISHNIVYPELPHALSQNQYADSLLQFYNIILAFNTMAYDIGTAERYLGERDFGLEQAKALDSINLSGIHVHKIKNLIRIICKKSAATIRRGERPTDQDTPEIGQLYDAFNDFSDPLYKAHLDDREFDPTEILSTYEGIHSKALTDTTSVRDEILDMITAEKDFQKKCVLARELAYANYHSSKRNDILIVSVLDSILRSNKYSPLLVDLWRMWRCMLQMYIFSGRSNDSAMYNLFYNQMRNQVALVYITHMKAHYDDKLAFKEFSQLVMTGNIVRNGPYIFGNNANIEEMELFYSVFHPENNNDND